MPVMSWACFLKPSTKTILTTSKIKGTYEAIGDHIYFSCRCTHYGAKELEGLEEEGHSRGTLNYFVPRGMVQDYGAKEVEGSEEGHSRDTLNYFVPKAMVQENLEAKEHKGSFDD